MVSLTQSLCIVFLLIAALGVEETFGADSCRHRFDKCGDCNMTCCNEACKQRFVNQRPVALCLFKFCFCHYDC